MKRFICAAAILFLMLITAGCSEQSSSGLFASRDEAILKVDGRTLLTAQDYLFAEEYAKAEAEFLGAKQPSREELFIEISETALCSMFSEIFGANADVDQLNGEYELYLEDLSEEDADFKCRERVMREMELSGGEFRELFVARAYRESSASGLVAEIAEDYGNILDPIAMEDSILFNLQVLSEEYEIEILFPNMEDHYFNYESVVL